MYTRIPVNHTDIIQAARTFEKFVYHHSGFGVDFVTNPFLISEEGYKSSVATIFRQKMEKHLNEQELFRVIKLTLLKFNLVNWHNINYFEHTYHYFFNERLYLLSNLFYERNNETSFKTSVAYFGGKYDLISTLFFLKDATMFLPVSPRGMDRAFSLLNIPFKTNRKCSWENYRTFLQISHEMREILTSYFGTNIRLIDVQSFLWMIYAHRILENA